MAQSNTLSVGLDVHQESIAVAYMAKNHAAEVVFLGTIGTRQCALDQRIRKLQPKAQPLVSGDEAGPCGCRLNRYLSRKGYPCRAVAPP